MIYYVILYFMSLNFIGFMWPNCHQLLIYMIGTKLDWIKPQQSRYAQLS